MSAGRLNKRLRRMIATRGEMALETFMAAAVETYYASAQAFGRDGDFVTAPEISQTFGELLGLWAAVAWQGMGMPRPVRLVELGPGRGLLMADALRAARNVPGFLDAVDLHLVEKSPALRRLQQEATSPWLHGKDRRRWHDRFEDVPEGPTILLANEFLDALPIRQYERVPAGWRERRIGLDAEGKRFVFVLGADDVSDQVHALCPASRGAAAGDVVEDSPAARAVVAMVSRRLVREGGIALWVDYGYGRPAVGDSLQAVHRHAFVPPLESPGQVDLTAHVDFSALRQSARAEGAETYGPITQGRFLKSLGVEQRAQALTANASPEQAERIAAGVRRLIHPEAMGDLFKVCAVAAPATSPPPGFEGSHDYDPRS